MADIIIDKIYKQNMFSWGAGDLIKQGELSAKYLVAIREADKNNFDELIKFARS
jgi:hypothetical protein